MLENQNSAPRSLSLRSVLLIMLIVGFGVGVTVFTLGNAAVTGLARSTSQQSTSTTDNTVTAHNCTRTA